MLTLKNTVNQKTLTTHADKVIAVNPRIRPEPAKTVPTNLEEVDVEDNVEILNRLEKEPSSGSIVVTDPPRAVEFLRNPREERKRKIKINSNLHEFSNFALILTQAG